LKETLLPMLHQENMVVMDNMCSHHVQAVRETFDASGVTVLHLPPYSRDLNPIKKMWFKVKAILYKWKIHSLNALPDAIHHALDMVSVADYQHWFAASC